MKDSDQKEYLEWEALEALEDYIYDRHIESKEIDRTSDAIEPAVGALLLHIVEAVTRRLMLVSGLRDLGQYEEAREILQEFLCMIEEIENLVTQMKTDGGPDE